MAKSPDAFRTISEVADWLGIQAHVLRFWESKFSQVKPIKRAGGRRYYRPADMLLLGGIKKLLHDDGLTIKGVQKLLREEGMGHVADLSQPLDDMLQAQVDDAPAESPVAPEEDGDNILTFEARSDEPAPENDAPVAKPEEPAAEPEEPQPLPVDEMMEEIPAKATEELPEAVDPEPAPRPAEEEAQSDMPVQEPAAEETPAAAPPSGEEESAPEEAAPEQPAPGAPQEPPSPAFVHRSTPEETAEPKEPAPTPLPAFLRRPLSESAEAKAESPDPAKTPETEADQGTPVTAEPDPVSPPEPAPPPAPKPRVVEVELLPPEDDEDARPGTLTAAYRIRAIGPARATEIAPLLTRLSTLRDAMNARRRGAGNGPPGG